MTSGIIATVAVHEPSACPVASLSREERVRSVSRGRPSGGTVPLEVTTDGQVPDDSIGELMFSYDSRNVYRVEQPVEQGCACEAIEEHGSPIRDVSAESGEVVFSFIVPDLDTLRDVIADLRARDSSVSVRCLRRSGTGDDESEPVFVDKSALTARQRETLRTAHEMGYFERPRRANASEVADELDVAPSTFAEHLAAAQTKLMDAVFPDLAQHE